MRRKTLFFIFICSFLFSCNEESLIRSERILLFENNNIYYDCYQLGIDNYRFDFYVVDINLSDTFAIGKFFINDAGIKNISFDSKLENDSVFIICNYPSIIKMSESNYHDLIIKLGD